MIKNYFSLDDNFNDIIEKSLPDKNILNIKPISTGWTNIVFEVSTNSRELFFQISKGQLLD